MIVEKEVKILKENGEWYVEGFEGEKERGLWCNYNIISRNKENNS